MKTLHEAASEALQEEASDLLLNLHELNWETIVRLEPGLQLLLDEANAFQTNHPGQDPDDLWYLSGGIKQRMIRLVGVGRKRTGIQELDTALISSCPYDIAYRTLYRALSGT